MDVLSVIRQNIRDKGDHRIECLNIGYYGKSTNAYIEVLEDFIVLKNVLTSPPVILKYEDGFSICKEGISKGWGIITRKKFNGKFFPIPHKRLLAGDNIDIFQKYLISDIQIKDYISRVCGELKITNDISFLEGKELSFVVFLTSSNLCRLKANLLDNDPMWYAEAQKFLKDYKKVKECLTVKQSSFQRQVDMPDVIMGEIELGD